MNNSNTAIEKFRQEFRSKNIPAYYIGWVHFMLTTVISITIIYFGIIMLDHVHGLQWLTIPLTFLYANLAEYWGHKGPMHHLRKPLQMIYQRHSKEHHVFFTDKHMPFGESRDYKAVLFPISLIVFFFGLFGSPIWFLLSWLFSSNVAWLFVVTGVAYFLNYEWFHFAYHCAEDSWVMHIPGFKKLRRLHLHHHNQKLMARYNFNITYPICDILFGTYYKD